MANVLVVEPVHETRVLIEQLVRRMGHEVVSTEAFRNVDVVFYEPASRAGVALARRVQAERPEVRLVACSAAPVRTDSARSLSPFASLMQPFSPGELKRVLEAALLGSVTASSTS
jgi:two-component SAPR family response regulator